MFWGIAFQYSYNGKIYQVGEFSQDVPPDTTLGVNPGAQKVIYLKMLKATSQRTNLPIWDLMMKNIYTLKTGTGSYLSNIQSAGFQMNILYEQAGNGTKRYLPAGPQGGIPLLTILKLDRLNAHPGSTTGWCIRLCGRLYGCVIAGQDHFPLARTFWRRSGEPGI